MTCISTNRFSYVTRKNFHGVKFYDFDCRDCWPVRDKKEEQQFRKVCHTWLSEISKDEPDSFLPRINPSLLMSPGGEKFYYILLAFSTFVVQKCAMQEHGNDMLHCERLLNSDLRISLSGT